MGMCLNGHVSVENRKIEGSVNGHVGENESGPHASESVRVEKAPQTSFPKDAVDEWPETKKPTDNDIGYQFYAPSMMLVISCVNVNNKDLSNKAILFHDVEDENLGCVSVKTSKRKIVQLEPEPVMLEGRDSLQQMESMSSNGITLHGYYGTQSNVQGLYRSRPWMMLFTQFPAKLKSHKSDISKPQTKKTQDNGIPIDLVKTLAKFKSRHFIRVLEVSRKSDHPFAGSRLILLDTLGNIHSISFLLKLLTGTYFDVFATFPPILPPGPLGILGFGAGSAAKLILELYPQGVVHGWELDPAVISVGREYFGLSKLERQYPDRLFIYVGNALNANIESGFSGLLVDLFSKGCLIPELQDPDI
ncbi:hypothetical protein L1987_00806 [Smallanthus sonchifolius]|uniref:Uncharacterized protein n=1 Tax=Smallanthus sonchifolius TaxID=185202 RepID=A0ACB9K395_9ASTR|nr:hypothetical protein L1987_00806 [Smallanthus sonchifolius]